LECRVNLENTLTCLNICSKKYSKSRTLRSQLLKTVCDAPGDISLRLGGDPTTIKAKEQAGQSASVKCSIGIYRLVINISIQSTGRVSMPGPKTRNTTQAPTRFKLRS
jgi:hypothetical protein